MNSVFLIACALIVLAVQNKYTYMILVLIVYSCYAGNYSVYPIQTVRILGPKNGPKYYWVTYTGFSLGAILQFFLHYFLV